MDTQSIVDKLFIEGLIGESGALELKKTFTRECLPGERNNLSVADACAACEKIKKGKLYPY
eukprot:4556057-Amphidinium_carterae.1